MIAETVCSFPQLARSQFRTITENIATLDTLLGPFPQYIIEGSEYGDILIDKQFIRGAKKMAFARYLDTLHASQ